MSTSRDHSAVPSPLLSLERVNEILINEIAEAGSMAGAIGGSASSFVGAVGGGTGGAAGARLGARRLTKLDGAEAHWQQPRTNAAVHAVRSVFFADAAHETFGLPPDSQEPALMLVGIVGSGAGGMNPCVIQIVWFEDWLHVFAHAREGLIKQRACARTLENLSAVLANAAQGPGQPPA